MAFSPSCFDSFFITAHPENNWHFYYSSMHGSSIRITVISDISICKWDGNKKKRQCLCVLMSCSQQLFHHKISDSLQKNCISVLWMIVMFPHLDLVSFPEIYFFLLLVFQVEHCIKWSPNLVFFSLSLDISSGILHWIILLILVFHINCSLYAHIEWLLTHFSRLKLMASNKA